MRKYLPILIIAVPFYCSAQFEKLTVFTSGSGSFTSQKTTQYYNIGASGSTKTSTFTFSPKVGIFVIDNLLVGPNISLSLSTIKPSITTITGDSKSTSWAAGPFVRYYLYHGLFLQADYTWGSSKSSIENNFSMRTDTQTNKSSGFNAGAGYTVFLDQSKSVAIDLSLVYRNRIQKISGSPATSLTKVEDSGLLVSVGLSGFLKFLSAK